MNPFETWIDADWCESRNACYRYSRLFELFPSPRLLQDVLTRNWGAWADVPWRDRLWVAVKCQLPRRFWFRVLRGSNAQGQILRVDYAWSVARLLSRGAMFHAWNINYAVFMEHFETWCANFDLTKPERLITRNASSQVPGTLRHPQTGLR